LNTARLKNIIILILALFNAFLLILLFSQQFQQRSAKNRSMQQLEQLFSSSGLSIRSDILSANESFYEYAVTTNSSAQEAFAAAILGDSTRTELAGSVRYEGKNGYCQFRTNGNVEASFSNLVIDDPLAFSEEIFKSYGYRILDRAKVGNGGEIGTVTGTRCTESGIIYNAALSFTFSGKTLTSVSGSFLPDITALSSCDCISATTALVDFLDYYNAGSLVCTEVTDLQSGYLLQGFASSQLKLAPVWYIETDVGSCYVDCVTGEVSRI